MNDSNADTDTGAWGTTEFRPGLDVGLVARHTIGLIARDNPSTRERLWELVSTDAPLDDILDELSSTGLKALPDFGVVQMEEDGARLVARGRAAISTESADGTVREIDASDVRTWVEDVVADVVAVTVTIPAAAGDQEIDTGSDTFAVLAGSVPARSLTRRFDTADPLAEPASAPSGWQPAQDSRAASVEDGPIEPADDDGVVDAVAADDAPLDDMPAADLEMPADADEPDDLDDEAAEPSVAPGDSWFDDPGAVPGSATPSEPIPPQPAVGDDDAASAEAPRDITADPVDPSSALAAVAPSGPGTGGAPPVSATADITPPPPVDSTTVVGGDPAGGALFEESPGPATQVFTEDRDGMTMSRDELEAQQPPSDASPVFAVLAFSNGERIDVDRAVLIGRNPKVAGSAPGGLPHIMKFDGPGQGLSRTHAEVRVEAGELLLEDLQSTNGTEVQLPGQQRRRLRAGEPVVITPGSLIDFGDELHCTVETAS